jgi:hypothetical protein
MVLTSSATFDYILFIYFSSSLGHGEKNALYSQFHMIVLLTCCFLDIGSMSRSSFLG